MSASPMMSQPSQVAGRFLPQLSETSLSLLTRLSATLERAHAFSISLKRMNAVTLSGPSRRRFRSLVESQKTLDALSKL